MATIEKRGSSYRARVTIYQHGKRDYLTKTFKTENEAKVWGTTLELEKKQKVKLLHIKTHFLKISITYMYIPSKLMMLEKLHSIII